METWLGEWRYGARLVRRSPVFACTAIVSLAIGLGATTTIFTIANALLFRAPPGVTEPERVIEIFRTVEGRTAANFTLSYPYYRDLRDRATTLAAVYAFEFEPRRIDLGLSDGTETAHASFVTAHYFAALGVGASAGRLFDERDGDVAGASPVVVISHRFWTRRFDGDPGVVGRAVLINRHPFTIAGVAAESFRGTNLVTADLWVEIGMSDVLDPGSSRLTRRDADGLGLGGRLEPGVSRAQAAAELDAIALAIERDHPEERGARLQVAALSSVPGPIATVATGFFGLLLALVLVVLVIACVNLAGVLLAQAAARRREMAVRAAIGAGRVRLARQLLTETALLFVCGGAAGLLLARGLTSLLLKLLPAFDVPVDLSLPLDGRALAFTATLSFVAAVLSGLSPALHVVRADLVRALGGAFDGPSDRQRLRQALVMAQVAFSLMLVVVAALLGRALERVSASDRGFDPQGIEVASLDLSRAGYTDVAARAFARDLVERLQARAGVAAATLATAMPGSRGGAVRSVSVPGLAPAGGDAFLATWRAVDRAYFATLRLPLLAGREFGPEDQSTGEPVAVVSETTARRLWPDRDAIGQLIVVHGQAAAGGAADALRPVRVIGVARDEIPPNPDAPRTQIRQRGREGTVSVREGDLLAIYVPLQQFPARQLIVLARGVEPTSIAPDLREIVRSLDADLPPVATQPLAAATGPIHLQLRVAAAVAGAVGLVGLLLTGIGIYGVTAYHVSQRTREIGIRVAIGASRGQLVRMVLRQGLALVGVGAIAGLMLALASGRLLMRMFAAVPALDVSSAAAAATLFGLVGFAACYVPVRRALRIEVVAALRND
jgi:predicted permease